MSFGASQGHFASFDLPSDELATLQGVTQSMTAGIGSGSPELGKKQVLKMARWMDGLYELPSHWQKITFECICIWVNWTWFSFLNFVSSGFMLLIPDDFFSFSPSLKFEIKGFRLHTAVIPLHHQQAAAESFECTGCRHICYPKGHQKMTETNIDFLLT